MVRLSTPKAVLVPTTDVGTWTAAPGAVGVFRAIVVRML